MTSSFAGYCLLQDCFRIQITGSTFKEFGFNKALRESPFQVTGGFRYQGLIFNLVDFSGPVQFSGNTVQ